MKIYVHNTETGKAVERDMTAEEVAQWEADQAASEAVLTEAAAAATAKAALLKKLGITADEAALLLG
jgi:hypothetical protein